MNNEENKEKLEKEEEKSELEKLKETLNECEKLRDEYLAGWQRQRADFLNYQKEVGRKMEEIVKFANEELIGELLLVLDSFEIALNSLEIEGLTETEKRIVHGLELIKNQLEDILRKKGLEEIKAEGEIFNPEFHEAVEEINGEAEGRIAEVVIKGYQLNGKVIRPAKVKVIRKLTEKTN